jgi:hypothetical protein
MADLIKKTKATPPQMEIQADLIATALVRELRTQAMGIGWALAPGLFAGFLAMAFIVSLCAGLGWLFIGVIL